MCEPAEFYAEFYSERFPVARKERLCNECRSTIRRGDQYWTYCGKWDGDVTSSHTCAACRWIIAGMYYHYPDFCWGKHSLRDDIKEEAEWCDTHVVAKTLLAIMNQRIAAARKEVTA